MDEKTKIEIVKENSPISSIIEIDGMYFTKSHNVTEAVKKIIEKAQEEQFNSDYKILG